MGHRLSARELVENIDKVTVERARAAAFKLISSSKPSLAALGDISTVPAIEMVAGLSTYYSDELRKQESV